MKAMGRLNRIKIGTNWAENITDGLDSQYHIEFDTKPDIGIFWVDMGLNTDYQNGLKKNN